MLRAPGFEDVETAVRRDLPLLYARSMVNTRLSELSEEPEAPFLGAQTSDIDASREIWRFFERHSLAP